MIITQTVSITGNNTPQGDNNRLSVLQETTHHTVIITQTVSITGNNTPQGDNNTDCQCYGGNSCLSEEKHHKVSLFLNQRLHDREQAGKVSHVTVSWIEQG